MWIANCFLLVAYARIAIEVLKEVSDGEPRQRPPLTKLQQASMSPAMKLHQ
jgi:hypothetical protein